MGRYIKISLALFYFLQLFIGFRESVVLLFEGVSEMAKDEAADAEQLTVRTEPSPDSRVRRSLFFLRHAFDIQRRTQETLTSHLAAALILHHELHHHFDADGGKEHATAAEHAKRRRLALHCIRNLFSELLSIPLPTGSEHGHQPHHTQRTFMAAT